MTESDDDPDRLLSERVGLNRETGGVASTVLRADTRVLARVTDGIYRQPSSAIRELISNAYDADARRIVVTTDRPRFNSIRVDDDGVGMSLEAVIHLLHHIGGSAKRSSEGAALGVTDPSDRLLSPGGRRLIGKIGIGLFSIAQLTRSFQITTKVKGDAWRTIATVTLRQYSDQDPGASTGEDGKFEAGLVKIWQEPAVDVDSHGTTIDLTSIRPKTKSTLQSVDRWAAVEEGEVDPPALHIGGLLPKSQVLWTSAAGEMERIPWHFTDDPATAFRKLVAAVSNPVTVAKSNPKLELLCDYYLQMIWQLSLEAPIGYLDAGPFDEPLEQTLPYVLPGGLPETAKPIALRRTQTIREALDLPILYENGDPDFTVVIDDLELRRPLRFDHLPTTTNKVRTPMLFVGGLHEEFSGVDAEVSGGPLSFRAYVLWAPRILPTDHVGVMIRVAGASGIRFDPTFLKFPVAESTRLRQMSCEIFISEGFDASINIDRESFNFAHPHVVRLTSWLHNALRRAINEQKRVATAARHQHRQSTAKGTSAALEKLVEEVWTAVGGEPEDVPVVRLIDHGDSSGADIVLKRRAILGPPDGGRGQAAKSAEERLIAIVQVLAAYDLLDDLTPENREALLAGISRILRVGS